MEIHFSRQTQISEEWLEHLLWYFDKLQFWRPEITDPSNLEPPEILRCENKKMREWKLKLQCLPSFTVQSFSQNVGNQFLSYLPVESRLIRMKILSKDIQRTTWNAGGVNIVSQNCRCNAHLFINLRHQEFMLLPGTANCVRCLTASVSRCCPSNCWFCELACLIQCWLTMARPLELALLSMICQFYLRSPKAI